MSLVDRTYFIGDINIPQLSQPAVQEKLDALIASDEPQLLRAVLGNALYLAFSDGLTHDPIDQKWIDLRDGRYYQDSKGNTFYWIGLTNSEMMLSLIANYVYFHFVKNDVVQLAGIGAVMSEGENATRVSPTSLMTRAWNQMVDWIHDLYHYLKTNNNEYFIYDIQYPDADLRGDVILIAGDEDAPAVGAKQFADESLDGYQYDLERRGVGTLINGVEWDYLDGGGFKLLQQDDQFYDGDVFVLHFKPHITEITASPGETYPEWNDHCIPHMLLEKVNDFGI